MRLFYSQGGLAIIRPDNRHECSIVRHNEVHDMYDSIMKELGELRNYVSKTYVYDRIRKKTGFSIRHISRILCHTKKTELYL